MYSLASDTKEAKAEQFLWPENFSEHAAEVSILSQNLVGATAA